MIKKTDNEMREVLSRVAKWPAGDRILLARRILESIEAGRPGIKRGYSAEDVIALLKMPQPAPNDEECRRMLEAERLRKYGS